MVYFKTNWIKDSNQWVIRKIRPWAYGGGILFFAYHFTQIEYLGRRVVLFKNYFDPRSEKEKLKAAEEKRSRWGYQPRFEPTLERSIKKRKYDQQTLEEMVNDTPRIDSQSEYFHLRSTYVDDYNITDTKDVKELFYALLEHAREPGAFDYTQPQTHHAVFPDVETQAYVTLNSNQHRKLKISKFSH
jgi:hypothetical protein